MGGRETPAARRARASRQRARCGKAPPPRVRDPCSSERRRFPHGELEAGSVTGDQATAELAILADAELREIGDADRVQIAAGLLPARLRRQRFPPEEIALQAGVALTD